MSPLKNRYHIIRFIGMGASARVYQGVDHHAGDDIAIKINLENHGKEFERELRSYRLLEGVVGIPRVRWSGLESGRGVLVMDWFPADLGQVFRCIPRSFTPLVIARIAEDVIGILERVHSKGLVHGDIKPNNLALTCASPGVGRVYLIDFGFARKTRTPNAHGKAKKSTNFEGNPYFASINALCGYNQSRRDDLESLAYVLIYFHCQGVMPWDYLMPLCNSIESKSQGFLSLLAECKLAVFSDEDGPKLPYLYRDFLNHSRSLEYGDVPDYGRYKNAFRQLAESEMGMGGTKEVDAAHGATSNYQTVL